MRKAALWNLPLGKATLPHILKRTRDKDAQIRKSVYLRLIKEHSSYELSKEQRNEILKNGLFDREENVKKACLKFLCEKWIGDDVDVLQLLEKVDVIDPNCTEAAVKSYFLAKPDITLNYDGILLLELVSVF